MSLTGPDRWRDVRLAAIATGISYFGDFLAATALVLALQARGAGGMAVAALLLAATVPVVLLAPVVGRLVDRANSRTLLVSVGLAQTGACAVLAFTAHPVAIIALVALLAAGLAFVSPTLQALLPDMVGSEALPRANAMMQSGVLIGLLGGPALAGFLAEHTSTRVPLLIDAVSYLAVAAAGTLISTRRHHGRSGAGGPTAPLRTAVGVLRRDRVLSGHLVLGTVCLAALMADNVVGVFLVRETLGASPTVFGLIEVAWTVGMLAGAWLLGRRGGSDLALVMAAVTAFAGIAAVQLGVAAVPGAWWLIPLYIVGGVGNGTINVARTTLFGRRVPDAQRGRVLAFAGAVANLAMIVGYVAGGVLVSVISPRAVFALTGGVALVAALVFGGRVVRAARAERTAEPAPAYRG